MQLPKNKMKTKQNALQNDKKKKESQSNTKTKPDSLARSLLLSFIHGARFHYLCTVMFPISIYMYNLLLLCVVHDCLCVCECDCVFIRCCTAIAYKQKVKGFAGDGDFTFPQSQWSHNNNPFYHQSN